MKYTKNEIKQYINKTFSFAVNKGVIMFILKANGQCIDDNGDLETYDIYITAPTIDECFEGLVKYKDESELYITVEKVYLA